MWRSQRGAAPRCSGTVGGRGSGSWATALPHGQGRGTDDWERRDAGQVLTTVVPPLLPWALLLTPITLPGVPPVPPALSERRGVCLCGTRGVHALHPSCLVVGDICCQKGGGLSPFWNVI